MTNEVRQVTKKSTGRHTIGLLAGPLGARTLRARSAEGRHHHLLWTRWHCRFAAAAAATLAAAAGAALCLPAAVQQISRVHGRSQCQRTSEREAEGGAMPATVNRGAGRVPIDLRAVLDAVTALCGCTA